MTGIKRVARRTCIDCVESRSDMPSPFPLSRYLSSVFCCAMWLWPVAIMGVVCIMGVICTWPSHTSVLVDGWVARARQCRWASGRPSPAPLMQLRYVRHTDPVRCTGCVSVCVCTRALACVHSRCGCVGQQWPIPFFVAPVCTPPSCTLPVLSSPAVYAPPCWG